MIKYLKQQVNKTTNHSQILETNSQHMKSDFERNIN